jgi:uncharacterized membrane protein YfcA
MNGLKEALVGLASAILSSMGLGGGGVLLVYLTGFTSLSQINAQGINLIFFIPIAFVSCVLHLKNKLILDIIRWRNYEFNRCYSRSS